jgi:E3 ubiquitin-protein ligase MARCH6
LYILLSALFCRPARPQVLGAELQIQENQVLAAPNVGAGQPQQQHPQRPAAAEVPGELEDMQEHMVVENRPFYWNAYIAFKVAFLLLLEMFLFPCIIGIGTDFCTLDITEASVASRLRYLKQSPAMFIIVHWFFGLIFVLQVNSFASQLRNIMRKRVLSKILRYPDDDDFHPLRDLVNKPLLKHLRRLCLSLLIYGSLVYFCLNLPTKIFLRTWPSLAPFRFNFGEAEMPADLLLFHFCLPFIVEWLDVRKALAFLLKAFFQVVLNFL